MKTLLLGLVLALGADGGLTREEFARLHEKLKPPTDEAWRSVPWKVSLVEAQHLAAKEKKPILIWSMDGNPLGCG